MIDFEPVFSGATKKLIGFYNPKTKEFLEPIGREKAFTMDNYEKRYFDKVTSRSYTEK